MIAKSLEMAWAGGLFEGEGCISRHSKNDKTNHRWALQMASTDRDVIEQFVKIVGVGKLYGPYQLRQRTKDGSLVKPLWRWNCANKEGILEFAEAIGPYLGERRSSMLKEALADLEHVNAKGTWTKKQKRKRVKIRQQG